MPVAIASADLTEFSFFVPCNDCEDGTVLVTARVKDDNLIMVEDEDEDATCAQGHRFTDDALFLERAVVEFEHLVEGRKLGAI